jgi:hypothetical protein
MLVQREESEDMATEIRTDWLGKDDVPTTSTLFELLEQGIPCRVSDHSLSYDGEALWITNPYGIDCGYWPELTAGRVKNFLADMAMGREYGAVP